LEKDFSVELPLE